MRKRNLILGGLAVFIGLGAVGTAAGGSSNAADTTATATTPPAAATASPAVADATTAPAVADATTAPSVAPEAAGTVTIGQPIKVDDDLTVTVLDAKYSTGSQYLKPAKGYVYMGLKVRYEAANEAYVSSNDWNVLADGSKQGHWTIVGDDAWEPALMIDKLAAGASTEGWITFEVPKPANVAEVRFDNKPFSDDPAQMVLKVQTH
jgi:Domain of unknown function (DUF4352)